MKAASHPQETARLGALRRYAILDTPRERDFDEVVRYAARLCDAPVAVINLIDADRQWFKAEVGLGVDETPLDTSLCAHVILQDDFVEIPDTLADSRMSDNPLCIGDGGEGGFRFYAGALLRSAEGYPIGTLCVLDTRTRTLSDLQRDGLQVLADQVVAQIELRAVLRRETMLRREIDHRVKNSLQSVGSFVRLQRRTVDGADAIDALTMVEQQVGTVAVLHDLLGQTTSSERIDLADYLSRVVALLAQTVPAGVAVDGGFASLQVAASVAVSLATVINELVANAVKHSFADGAAGRIVLEGRLDEDAYRISCRDNGRPPTDAVPATKREGLGLRIMDAAVRQLDGSLVSAPEPEGFASLLTFPTAMIGNENAGDGRETRAVQNGLADPGTG